MKPGVPLSRAAPWLQPAPPRYDQAVQGRNQPPAYQDAEDQGAPVLTRRKRRDRVRLLNPPLIPAPYGRRRAVRDVDPEAGEDPADVPYARPADAPFDPPQPRPSDEWAVNIPDPDEEDRAAAEEEQGRMPWPAEPDAWQGGGYPMPEMEEDLEAPGKPGKAGRTAGQPRTTAGDSQQQKKRLGRSAYDAMETHGHFGMVDGGETSAAGIRRVVVHVPKRSRGYVLDIQQGDVIFANSARGRPIGGRLEVAYVSRHRYVPPGHAVSTCVVGVPEEQWRRFQ